MRRLLYFKKTRALSARVFGLIWISCGVGRAVVGEIIFLGINHKPCIGKKAHSV